MSLRHAILALLTADPMTGYDLSGHFDDAVAFLWSAPHSQIYPELRRMEADGLVAADEVPRGERARKRVYSLTEDGRKELSDWLAKRQAYSPERDVHRLKSAYLELGDLDAAQRHFETHRRHHRGRLERWKEVMGTIYDRRHPLLRLRLEKFSPEMHDAIVAYKALAFEGEVARSEAEIAWAQQGLELVEKLRAEAGDLTAG